MRFFLSLLIGLIFSSSAFADKNLGLPPLTIPNDNPQAAEKIALGRLLFNDKRFSANGSVSCVSCHHADKAFSDGLPVAIGINGQAGVRNAPTVINAAFYQSITYTFKQMHFHTPSEHLIDGITFPMELHIVSATKNPASPQYLVIAILFKMGEESKFINEFLNIIPDHEHSKTDIKAGSIRFTDLLSLSPTGDLGHHYHYKGSLTTPPYTESVNWFVLKQIFEASPEQIKAINKLEGDNARHIKDKNNRLVEDN